MKPYHAAGTCSLAAHIAARETAQAEGMKVTA